MKSHTLGILLFALAATAFAGDGEDVLALDHEMAVATWTADLSWFDQHLDESFILITAGGRLRSKADVIAELSTPGLTMEPYEATEVQVRIYGGTAIVTGRAWQRYTLKGSRYDADLRYTDVWIKKKGKWSLVSTHASAIPKKK